MSAANTQPPGKARASASCPKCGGAGLYIRTRHFEGEAADVWECRAPQCTSFGLIWHVSRGFNDEEKSLIRRRVMVAESALLKARNAVAEAEGELAVARHLAAAIEPKKPAVPPRVQPWRLVRRLPIDWRGIAKETGCTKGTLSRSPVFGWGVRGNGPADFCAITPPTIAEGEELRIEEGMWAVYSPNAQAEPRDK